MAVFQTNTLPGRTVLTTDGTEYLWFSGTDYLGMGHNEEFRSCLLEGINLYGTHFGSSRNNSLRLGVFEEVETLFARFVQGDSALLISSGMLAGQLVMKEIENVLKETGEYSNVIYHYAPRVHPAIWGKNYTSNETPWNSWAASIVTSINDDSKDSVHIICTDATGSPMVEEYDLSIFNLLHNVGNVWLIVDESHSLGVSGPNGDGAGDKLHATLREKTIFLSSLNKALGIPGGAIWGSEHITALLRKSPWFAGASPPTPAYAYTLKKLLETNVYGSAFSKLSANIAYLNSQIPNSDLFVSLPGYPVMCSKSTALFDHLLKNGIMASCFSYPLPTDAPITRLAISSIHQKEDLNRLAEVCNRNI
ncbi:MAG: aminotransferase class I/II-fold pyridoxal phosphate-dependent enzyme [Dyadobacter sp.]|uniref:aminotransferase class I/II-fold pyridoxal phosphate-dependent enzyme n=1 Tax=Dyadobacter sp. TaxID=1914288 RepID=UPI003265922C